MKIFNFHEFTDYHFWNPIIQNFIWDFYIAYHIMSFFLSLAWRWNKIFFSGFHCYSISELFYCCLINSSPIVFWSFWFVFRHLQIPIYLKLLQLSRTLELFSFYAGISRSSNIIFHRFDYLSYDNANQFFILNYNNTWLFKFSWDRSCEKN